MNKKGFTLVELLAVIVILGILLTIAIPAASNYINSTRRESFVVIMKEYAEAVRRGLVSEEYQVPMDPNMVTIISFDLIPLDKGKRESSYASEWVDSKSYVAVVNVGSSEYAKYKYFVAAQDKKGHAVPLMDIESITKEDVIGNAKNKMEVTIQALCGKTDGKITSLSTIKGLENTQLTDGSNNKTDWLATIYSGDNCAS